MEPSDADLLITRILEGEAAPAQVAAFRSACEADTALLRKFTRAVALHRLTASVVLGRDDESRFAAEVLARLQKPLPIHDLVEKRLRHTRSMARWRTGLGIAAALALAAGLMFFMTPRGGAVLTRSESVVWVSPHAADGERLDKGRVVELKSGLAEMHFNSQVSVLLEGPARMRITGPKGAFLDYGRLVARVTGPQGKGFVIDGPSGRVVDLGTAFGVSVARGGEMEVHVLEGEVNASSNSKQPDTVALRKDEAMSLGGGVSRRMAADEGAFVTDLPPLPVSSPAFIRWSMDEEAGVTLSNSGRGLAEDSAAAGLIPSENGSATRVSGRFGKALSFDGVDDYAESGFEGVSGQAPRSVALWARIPKDLKITESFAMIGWGRVEGIGSAWQISVNPLAREGPLGALRAGTGQAAVVGSTDLRDGRWHHLTVVMYGGGTPSTATHVLLYVDGKLESTTRKSVRAINTEPSTQPHGIWLGRNLSVSGPNPPAAYFFRGELDEVHIFSAAIDQPMIHRLMKNQNNL